MAERLAHIHPDVFTWIAFACALLAGLAFYLGGVFLPAAVVLVFSNALFDALDGKVAKVTGKASARGDFLDHVLDRYADAIMLAGIALGPYSGDLRLGLLAILGVLLASYMGTQAQAVGVGRDYGGLLGRADRLVMLLVAGIVQVFFAAGVRFGLAPLVFTPLEWALVAFAVLGHLTAVQRAATTWRKLRGR
jgi:archaetidylinositol phosphate synthase